MQVCGTCYGRRSLCKLIILAFENSSKNGILSNAIFTILSILLKATSDREIRLTLVGGTDLFLFLCFLVNFINSQSYNIGFGKSCSFTTCFQFLQLFIRHTYSVIICFGCFCWAPHFFLFLCYSSHLVTLAFFPNLCYVLFGCRRWQVPPGFCFRPCLFIKQGFYLFFCFFYILTTIKYFLHIEK